MSIYSNLWNKLRDKEYRDAFVASQLKRSIPFQISALRKKRQWSQEQLAEAAKLSQGVVSRAENPNYGNLTFNTVLRVAAGLDVAVVLEFVPFSKLIETFEKRSEDLAPQTFGEEDKKREARNELAAQKLPQDARSSILSDMVTQYKQAQAQMLNAICVAAVATAKSRSTASAISEATGAFNTKAPPTPKLPEVEYGKAA